MKNDPTRQRGRYLARKTMPVLGKCDLCDNSACDRHHKDGDPTNNTIENIQALCRKCHMQEDGRLHNLSEAHALYQPIRDRTPCVNCSAIPTASKRNGLCEPCYDYLRNNGVSRPEQYFEPRKNRWANARIAPCIVCGVPAGTYDAPISGKCSKCYRKEYYKKYRLLKNNISIKN